MQTSVPMVTDINSTCCVPVCTPKEGLYEKRCQRKGNSETQCNFPSIISLKILMIQSAIQIPEGTICLMNNNNSLSNYTYYKTNLA